MQPTCRLCGRLEPLRNSHIFPEFLYKLVYDARHRFELLDLGLEPSADQEQKGLREPLLCAKCEQLLGRHERYASQVLLHRTDLLWVTIGDTHYIGGVEYSPFKLFLMSLLWRAGVSSLPTFAQVRLGSHEVRLRDLLLRSDPGRPDEYPTCLRFFGPHRDIMRRALVPPQCIQAGPHEAYHAAFVGLLAIFIVAPQVSVAAGEELFLREDDVLPVSFIEPAAEQRYLRRIADQVAEAFPEHEA